MPKTNVYIDGFNFYYGAVKNTPYRWVNLAALCRHMLPNDTIQSIKYFTAIVRRWSSLWGFPECLQHLRGRVIVIPSSRSCWQLRLACRILGKLVGSTANSAL